MTLALARHLADSTAFALFIGLICLSMKRHGPAARYVLWLIAAAKFLVPVVFFFWIGESLRALFPAARVQVSVPAEVSEWIMATAVSAPPKAATMTWFDLLTMVWAIGIVVVFGLWLRTMWTFRVGRKRNSDSDLLWFAGLKDRIGLKSDVRLAVSDSIAEPALAGFTRPVVLIPAALTTQLSAAELQSVVLHELAHAKRRDNWTAAFAHAVTCVFWFYPVLWWIEKRLRVERELACDEMVIRWGAAADDYFAGILKACRFHLTREIAGVAGISGSNLKKRKEAIMSVMPESPSSRVPKTLIASLIAAVAIAPLAIGLLSTSNARAADREFAGATNAVEGTMFSLARQASAPAQLVEATFGIKSLFLGAKLENVGNRPITQYRIGWVVVYRDGKTDTSSGPAMNVPAEIAPRTVAEVPDQGVSGKLLNNKPREIMFFVDEARFSTGEVWNADTHSIATEAGSEARTAAPAPDPKTEASFTCTFQSVSYPEGTVIQEGNGAEQMCARVLDERPVVSSAANRGPRYAAEWIRTSKAARERSATVVRLPTPPPIYCTPTASTETRLCACENTGPFSPGALVNSTTGPHQLRCDNGDWVQTSTLNVKRP